MRKIIKIKIAQLPAPLNCEAIFSGLNCFIAVLITTVFMLSAFPVSAQETSYTYTNQEQDKSGLMHYDSRYYDPDLGRFLQPDPLDVSNKYSYVSNDPVNRIDPSGNIDIPNADDFFFPPQNSYIFSGIDPTNTDTYSTMFSDLLTVDNNFIVEDMVGPWGNLNNNLYLDASDDIAREQAYYRSNDARFIMSYEDYKAGNRPLYVDSSFGVNPVGMVGGMLGKMITQGKITAPFAEELAGAVGREYGGIYRTSIYHYSDNGLCIVSASCVLEKNNWKGALVQATSISPHGNYHVIPIVNTAKFGPFTVIDNSNFAKALLNPGNYSILNDVNSAIFQRIKIPDNPQIIMPFDTYYNLLVTKPFDYSLLRIVTR